jgi:superfamily II DNA or RNA helicase
MTSSSPGNFRDLELYNFYSCTGQEILESFVYPVLARSISYDRLTGYFSVESLVAAAEGLEGLFRNSGKMRLVIGIHDVPEELVAALAVGRMMPEDLVIQYRRRVIEDIGFLVDQASRNAISTIGWMMRSGHLEVRVAAPRGPRGIYHQKRMIFVDGNGNVIAGTGSLNETRGGQDNIEEMNFHFSWNSPSTAIGSFAEDFDNIWNGLAPDVQIFALDETFASNLLKEVHSVRHPFMGLESNTLDTARLLLEGARSAPVLGPFNVTGAAFYPHQERVYLEALSRWPVRVLLGDEVGLGKTLEAGAVIAYLWKYGGVKDISIMAPAGLLRQWQDEMRKHFDLNFWRWNSNSREYVSPTGEIVSSPYHGAKVAPRPRLRLISSQWALRHPEQILNDVPSMLVVDEAHSARLKRDEYGFRHTKMWELLDQISVLVPHMVLVTATPMQMHPVEYYGLLQLLGLSEGWSDYDAYEMSLELISDVSARATLQQATDLGKLIVSAVKANEWLPLHVTAEEIGLLEELDAALEVSRVRASMQVQKEFPSYRRILMKIHPAHFLTCRNTKSGLERFGYRFPTRTFSAPAVVMTGLLTEYESAVEAYLSNAYGEVERSLNPEGKSSVGFAKTGYYQRMVSSLFASQTTLERRRAKIEGILAALRAGDLTKIQQFFEAPGIDEDDPSLEDEPEENPLGDVHVDEVVRVISRVEAAVRIEAAYISDLMRILNSLEDGVIASDPKFKSAMTVLRESVATRKVLVFSRYTDTLDGFLQLFEASDLPSELSGYAMYTGGAVWVKDSFGLREATKEDVTRALNSGQIDLVFCSDAASEGLNLQAAQQIINLDVPWNPARLEQRIGRIARLGQKADEVHICNLWYPNSIEARMYQRLLERRDLYQLAVGEFPELFSSAITAEVSTALSTSGRTVDPIAELQLMRNDHQRLALEAIWGLGDDEGSPPSQEFRESLFDVISDARPERLAQLPSVQPGDEDALTLLSDVLVELCSDEVPLSPGDDVEVFAYYCGDICLGFAVRISHSQIGLIRAESWPNLFGAALGLRQVTISDIAATFSAEADVACDDFVGIARWLPDHQSSKTVFDGDYLEPPLTGDVSITSRSLGLVKASLKT